MTQLNHVRTYYGNLARGVSEGELPIDNAITKSFTVPGRSPPARLPRHATVASADRSPCSRSELC